MAYRHVRARRHAIAEALSRNPHKLTCYHCGCDLVLVEDRSKPQEANWLTVDHYPIPKMLGGQTKKGNLVAACRACNFVRGAVDAEKNGLAGKTTRLRDPAMRDRLLKLTTDKEADTNEEAERTGQPAQQALRC